MNNVKLICFDLDETIISHSSWQQLNLALGISKEDDRAMDEDFIAGRISYEAWNNNIRIRQERGLQKYYQDILIMMGLERVSII